MSLKNTVDQMKVVLSNKACRHGYDLMSVIRTLYAYTAELENKLDAPAPAKKAPAPAKKAPAPAKKASAPAKKASAPAKKATPKKAYSKK